MVAAARGWAAAPAGEADPVGGLAVGGEGAPTGRRRVRVRETATGGSLHGGSGRGREATPQVSRGSPQRHSSGGWKAVDVGTLAELEVSEPRVGALAEVKVGARP